jgi:hypothetical protein
VPLAKILLHCHPCECGDNKEILTVNIDRGLMQVGRYFVFGLLQW